MGSPMTVSTSQRPDGQVVVAATGELDMSNISDFSRALTEALMDATDQPVEVDLRAVEYLDSAAINVLFPYGNRLRLLVNSILMPVLTVSGLTRAMHVRIE